MLNKLKSKRGITMLEILISLALTVIVMTGVGTGIIVAGQNMDTARRIMNAEALADQLQTLITSDLSAAHPAEKGGSFQSADNLYGPDGTKIGNGTSATYVYPDGEPKEAFDSSLIKSANSPATNVGGASDHNSQAHQINYRPSILATVKGTNGLPFVTLTDGSARYLNIVPGDGSSMGSKLTKYNLVKIDKNGQSTTNPQKGTFHFEVAFDIIDKDEKTIISRDFKVYPMVNNFDLTPKTKKS